MNDERPLQLSRRGFCAAALCLAAGVPRVALGGTDTPIRIGTTSVILDNQVGFLHAWRDYLQPRLGRPVTFLQRGSYREITSLLLGDELDFAWVCGYPYVRNRAAWELVALPNYGGKPLYRSYLIVPATDTGAHAAVSVAGTIRNMTDTAVCRHSSATRPVPTRRDCARRTRTPTRNPARLPTATM